MEIAEQAYRFSACFPKEEVYGLTSQIRRAATSIAANIAEGHGREHSGSFVQFLRVAQGSLKELETHVLLSLRLQLASAESADSLLAQCNQLGRMLRSLIRSIQRRHADD